MIPTHTDLVTLKFQACSFRHGLQWSTSHPTTAEVFCLDFLVIHFVSFHIFSRDALGKVVFLNFIPF